MMIRIVERLAMALLIATALGARPREEVMAAKVFHAADGRRMPYRLFLPEDSTDRKKYTLVLFLHGGGGRAKGGLDVRAGAAASALGESPETGSVLTPCPTRIQAVSVTGTSPDPSSHDFTRSSKNLRSAPFLARLSAA